MEAVKKSVKGAAFADELEVLLRYEYYVKLQSDAWNVYSGYCCAGGHADSDGTGANAELPGLLGTGRRIVKPETAAFRASFTQAAAAAASAALVSQRFWQSVSHVAWSHGKSEDALGLS